MACSRLIIVRERHIKYYTCDTLKQMNPLSPFAILTINLEYSNRLLTHFKVGLYDPPLSDVKNVVDRWDIFFCNNSLCLGKEATR